MPQVRKRTAFYKAKQKVGRNEKYISSYVMHKLESFKSKLLAVWRSGNGVGRVNEVTLRRMILFVGKRVGGRYGCIFLEM